MLSQREIFVVIKAIYMPLNIHVFRVFFKRNTDNKKNVIVLRLQNSLDYRIQNSKFFG